MNTTENLIGKRFRRNAHGLSLWEDKIAKVEYDVELLIPVRDLKFRGLKDIPNYFEDMKESKRRYGYTVNFYVIGETNPHKYYFDEIVIYAD